jgi:hypothetical protein
MTVAETAKGLGLSKQNVKVRLHRARAALRRELQMRMTPIRTKFRVDRDRCGPASTLPKAEGGADRA